MIPYRKIHSILCVLLDYITICSNCNLFFEKFTKLSLFYYIHAVKSIVNVYKYQIDNS